MNDVGLSRYSAFGWESTPCWSLYTVSIYIASLPNPSTFSYVWAISLTYREHLSNSWPCAPGPCGELCSWMHEQMHHDGRHSSQLVLRIDHFLYDSYDITDLNYVSEFCLSFSFGFWLNSNWHDNIKFIDRYSMRFEVKNLSVAYPTLHMHRRIIMSHNLVAEIKSQLPHCKIRTLIALWWDTSSNNPVCLFTPPATKEPSPFICPNSIFIW